MNILILGKGNREYSIAHCLKKDKRVENIFFAPNNESANIMLNTKGFLYDNNEELLDQIEKNFIDLVIIGPELPLVEGVSDFLRAHNIAVFAPSKQVAMLEGSKAYMKKFISSINVPSARYKEIDTNNIHEGYDFIDSLNLPIVLKASGLCSGKGVLILHDKDEAKAKLKEMISGELFNEAGKIVVIEEYLDGYELSIFAICNGNDYIILPACKDYKRLLDNNEGVNTGGMGACTNLPQSLYNEELKDKINKRIIHPTLAALNKRRTPYTGTLFAGIMVQNNEPYLLEYNVRFGDPECAVLLPRLKSPLLDIILQVVNNAPTIDAEFNDDFLVGVVLSSCDYAQDIMQDLAQNDNDSSNNAKINSNIKSFTPSQITFNSFDENLGYFCLGATSVKDNKIIANTGRVALCVGRGNTLVQARENAYKIADSIDFEGKYMRSDIGVDIIQKI